MLERLGSIGCAEIPIDTRFGEVVVLHQRFDAHALGASVPEFGALLLLANVAKLVWRFEP